MLRAMVGLVAGGAQRRRHHSRRSSWTSFSRSDHWPCVRFDAVSGQRWPDVDFRRDARRQFCAWIAVHAGRLHRVHDHERSGPRRSFNFFGGLLLAALAVAAIGAAIEVVVLRRIYASPEIFQLLATFGVVLIVQDVALAIWGPNELFAPRAPGLKGSVEIAGALVPQYSMFV